MEYKALKFNLVEYEQYSIVPLREDDIFLIKSWRNAQMEVLRQKQHLTDSGQYLYYQNIIKPLFGQLLPQQILFSYLKRGICIGYGGLTNIDWESKRAEMSFLMDTKRIEDNELYDSEFSIFITLLKRVIFDDLEFNRLFTETYDIRPIHISVLEKNGFILEGIMKEHVIINNKFVDSLIHGFLKEYYNAEK